MVQTLKSEVIDAYKILNDICADLVIGTRSIEHLNILISYQIDKQYRIGLTRLCVFHLILTLNKYLEFYKHYHAIIPKDILKVCRELKKQLEAKQIPQFRNKVVGHIWDNTKKSPITGEDHDQLLQNIYGGSYSSFINWINQSEKDIFPETVVSIIDKLKKTLADEYRINDRDIFEY